MNAINWKPKAARQLRKLALEHQRPIRDQVHEKLSVFPDCTGVKQLKDGIYPYRLRIRNFRIFFDFDGSIKIVHIEEVKKRDERTY